MMDDWYIEAKSYWDNEAPISMDGVLGGFAKLDAPDIKMSRNLMLKLRTDWTGSVAADIAAGIGRITKSLLLPLGCARVDIIEQSAGLLSAAPEYVNAPDEKCRFFCFAMQEWQPKFKEYDIIWVQWCIGHFTDLDFIQFLYTCRDALTSNGILFIKDNVLGTREAEPQDDAFYVDEDDYSICRSYNYLRTVFDLVGVTILAECQQPTTSSCSAAEIDLAFPNDIYPVFAFALAWR